MPNLAGVVGVRLSLSRATKLTDTNKFPGKFWCFHNGVIDDSGLLECDAVLLGKWVPTFRKNLRKHFNNFITS
jgi:hypothetical protein